MMKDVVRRGSAASVWASGFHIPAGGKTGTTNDGTDVWFIGYTPDLVTGVWMGFDRPQKIQSNAQGGRLAAPAWTSFMSEIYQRRPAPPDWPRPEGIVVARGRSRPRACSAIRSVPTRRRERVLHRGHGAGAAVRGQSALRRLVASGADAQPRRSAVSLRRQHRAPACGTGARAVRPRPTRCARISTRSIRRKP